MPIEFVVPVRPVPFARAGSNGSSRYTPEPQRSYMNLIADYAFDAMDGLPPMTGPVELRLRFEYQVPASWAKKKRAASSRWKDGGADIDNLTKLVADSLQKIVFVNDAQVASLDAKKVRASENRVLITVVELPT